MSIIQVDNLFKTYDVYKKEPGFWGSVKSFVDRKIEKVKAVEGISFNIEEGELIGFIGPNGAGKTTTLKMLSGLLYPTSGKVSVLGYTPFKRDYQFLKQISLVMGQKNQLWWDLPAMESLLLNKAIYEVEDKKFDKVVRDLARIMDVEDLLRIQVRKLSLGQRMKMELIAALIHSPKVLFLDEPTIGLDVIMQKNLREFIKEYNKRYNATIILTSHYMGDVQELAKRVIVINHGAILFDGLLSNLVKRYTLSKTVNIVLSKAVNPSLFEGLGEIKEYSYPRLTISVAQESASMSAAKILQTLPVEDVTIEDPPIEDIIRQVFASNS